MMPVGVEEESDMTGTPLFSHILVPTDGSNSSIKAARLAIRLAASHGARLTSAYVVDSAVLEELTRHSQKTAQQVQHEMEMNGQRYLDYIARLASEHGIDAKQAIRQGNPHSEIISLADEEAVDLIVMGEIGRRGARRMLMGSVAERVIGYARCPVLVTK